MYVELGLGLDLGLSLLFILGYSLGFAVLMWVLGRVVGCVICRFLQEKESICILFQKRIESTTVQKR